MSQPISELPAFLMGLFTDTRDVLFDTATSIKERMAVTAPPRNGDKVKWDSDRQRRKVMAMLRELGQTYYVRKGTYERGWTVERQPLGAQLYNHTRGAGAIGGTPQGWQSRIHRNRWNYLLQILTDELNKIPDALRDKFTVRASND